MSTPLETWLEKEKPFTDLEVKAIAVIEKLKEALELSLANNEYALTAVTSTFQNAKMVWAATKLEENIPNFKEALAIDPEQL